MDRFIWLLFAHFIGDVALQNDSMRMKGTYWYLMVTHVMTYLACVSIALQFLGIFALWKVIFIFIGHFLMDEWKSHQPKTPETWWMIYPDQAWHIFQLLIVFLIK